MFESDLKEVAEARKAINFLQLEVADVICIGISKKVEAAFEAIQAQQKDSPDYSNCKKDCFVSRLDCPENCPDFELK